MVRKGEVGVEGDTEDGWISFKPKRLSLEQDLRVEVRLVGVGCKKGDGGFVRGQGKDFRLNPAIKFGHGRGGMVRCRTDVARRLAIMGIVSVAHVQGRRSWLVSDVEVE